MSGDDLAIVHNGIIENHEQLREEMTGLGYVFETETDTEVIVHRIHHYLKSESDLLAAVRATVVDLEGAYALVVISQRLSGSDHPRSPCHAGRYRIGRQGKFRSIGCCGTLAGYP